MLRHFLKKNRIIFLAKELWSENRTLEIAHDSCEVLKTPNISSVQALNFYQKDFLNVHF